MACKTQDICCLSLGRKSWLLPGPTAVRPRGGSLEKGESPALGETSNDLGVRWGCCPPERGQGQRWKSEDRRFLSTSTRMSHSRSSGPILH